MNEDKMNEDVVNPGEGSGGQREDETKAESI
jgi:hypothetical protein